MRLLKQNFVKIFTKFPDRLFIILLMMRHRFHLNRKGKLSKILFVKPYWLVVLENGTKFVIHTPKAVWLIPKTEDYECFFKICRGDTVIDVGASLGGFTIQAAKKVGPGGKVIAIEPEPFSYHLLKASLVLNGLKNVICIRKAIWNRKGTLKLYLSDDWNIGTHSLLNFHQGRRTLEVETDTLDSIISELGIQKVDFMKMDIEGAELEALEGAEQTLNITRKISVAAYHIRNGIRTSSKVAELLRKKGFKVISTGDYVYGKKRYDE